MGTEANVEPRNLNRSCNEALILAALQDGPKHGYQLALDIEQQADGYFRVQHGTLYPILHKLEKEGLIRGTWSPGGRGRKRKSYQLTKAGHRYATEQLGAWRAFISAFLTVVENPAG